MTIIIIKQIPYLRGVLAGLRLRLRFCQPASLPRKGFTGPRMVPGKDHNTNELIIYIR